MDYANTTLGGLQGLSSSAVARALPPKSAGLGDMLDIDIKRLTELGERLANIGNALYGPQPEEAANPDNNARPYVSLQSRMRQLVELIDAVERGVQRIENAL